MITKTRSRSTRILMAGLLFAAPVRAQQLPTADEVMSKFKQALGGEAVIKGHTMSHMVAEFEIPAQGMKGNIEIWTMLPDKLLVVQEIPGLAIIKQGFDGTTAWDLNPMTGPAVQTGKQLEQRKEQADLHSILHPERYAKSREVVEKTSFNNKDAYKVKVTTIAGDVYHEYYDVSTGLMVGSVRKVEGQMGEMEVSNFVDDYQTVDGQKTAMKMRQSSGPVEVVITVKKTEFTGVDPAIFELPKEIKALVVK